MLNLLDIAVEENSGFARIIFNVFGASISTDLLDFELSIWDIDLHEL